MLLTDYTTSLMATTISALLTSCIVPIIPQRTPPQAAVCVWPTVWLCVVNLSLKIVTSL